MEFVRDRNGTVLLLIDSLGSINVVMYDGKVKTIKLPKYNDLSLLFEEKIEDGLVDANFFKASLTPLSPTSPPTSGE